MSENFLNKKRSSRKKTMINVLVAVVIITVCATLLFIGTLSGEPITVSEEDISIYLHQESVDYIIARLRGGYKVRFDDIADIALSPYSARQLGDRINDLHLPALREGWVGSYGPRVATASYDLEENYRIHVSLFPDASPTIWITRYANVPVLLSFHYSHETEALYEQIVDAWEQWQAS